MAPPAPVVIILFALKEKQPISPNVPVCCFIDDDDKAKKLPILSDASSIILIFFFLHNFISFLNDETLPNT